MSYAVRLLCLLSVAAALATNLVHAAVFDVDTIVDDPGLTGCDDATPSDCSLRGAILKANGLSEPVTINLPAGTYVLSQSTDCFFAGTATIAFFHTQALCPTGNVTIIGSGATVTIIDANQSIGNSAVVAPVLLVATTAKVTMSGITMRKGNFSIGSIVGNGGGINNAGVLTLVDSVVTQNWTSGDGGGIYNQGDLTLLRSTISNNFSTQAGGGIVNTNLFGTCLPVSPCHQGQGIVTIGDSTISGNFAGADGGGISNFVGMIDISGTTISDNQAFGNGGGISNFAFNINLSNVTVSGNQAALGGGLFNQGANSSLRFNNVTVTANTAQSASDPTAGIGGGLVSQDFAIVNFGNTIIAGNVAAKLDSGQPSGADCYAPRNSGVTSVGYNVIQNPNFCDIAGDTATNIVGQDPGLGVLADNGGPTFTHALAPGSPAIDAGNPAIPGSGGSACAVTDQRAFLRSIGGRCDIGAFERGNAFVVTSVSPSSGGNVGQLSLRVVGGGFVEGAGVKLSRAGQPDIVARLTQVDVGSSAIEVTFDLTGKLPGAWNVVVTNPDSTSRTLVEGFTVRPGTGPDLWVDVVGPIFRHKPSILTILYGNRGDTDALGIVLSLSLPAGYQAARYFDIAPPPSRPGEVRPDWAFVPESVALPGQSGFIQVPLLLPIVPSGFNGVLRTKLVIPSNATDTFLLAATGDGLLAGGSASTFATNATTGAQSYLQQAFGITVPAALIPQMQQYATTQLQQIVADGQTAFVGTLGTQVRIYSLAQLQLDLVFFAATRAGSATP